jgi:hypothetical protein
MQIRILKDQQGADHLHPGGTAFGGRADHDITRTKLKVIPAGTIVEK